MLSPAKYHTEVPRDPIANLEFRLFVGQKAHASKEYQQAILQVCKRDILFWINTFVLQFNPKSIGSGSPKIGPFITWPFQDEAILRDDSDPEQDPGILWCLEHQKDEVCEKSREMGISWILVLVATWLLLFHDWYKILVVSRNADAVDKPDDPDSLFWKIDHVLEYLPDWMKEGVERRKMGFKNTKRKNFINGQATTEKAGVGGRCQLMIVDEFSQIDKDYEVFHRTSDTGGCRIFNGTHVGTGTCFYELTDRKSVSGSYIKHLVMHWTQHPDKRRGLYRYDIKTGKIEVLDKTYEYSPDFKFVMEPTPTGGPYPGLRSPWYDEQCKRKGSARAVAMDLDIDPKGSVSQVFDPVVINNLIHNYAEPARWRGTLRYDPVTGEPDRDAPFVQLETGQLELWLPGQSGKGTPRVEADRYFIAGDISQGQGVTPSCLSVVNSEGEKVCQFVAATMKPDQLAVFAVCMAKIFRDQDGRGAYLGWEANGPGGTFGKHVLDLGYRHIYYNELDPELPWSEPTGKPGWFSTARSKQLLLENYRAALSTNAFCNHSRDALEECLRFEYDGRGVPFHPLEESKQDKSGAKLNHGDITMADAICWMLAQRWVKKKKVQKEETYIPPNSLMARRLQRLRLEKARGSWG
jgi:hypothetical protein